MFKGVLVSLLASFLFGYMYYFSTLLKPLSGTDDFYVSLCCPFRVYV